MKTFTEFTRDSMHYWHCDAGRDEDGRQLLDVLVYETRADMDSDTDNSLAIDRAIVIDDR